jgi:hypothetical protein
MSLQLFSLIRTAYLIKLRIIYKVINYQNDIQLQLINAFMYPFSSGVVGNSSNIELHLLRTALY